MINRDSNPHIFYFSSEVEPITYSHPKMEQIILSTQMGPWMPYRIKQICMALSAILGPLKLWFFLHFQGGLRITLYETKYFKHPLELQVEKKKKS